MRTTLAHLEFENAQMKREVAKLRRENRELDDRMVQQEQDNGELAARLDDARNLIHDRGLDPTERAASRSDGSMESPDNVGGVRTLPAGQSNRKRRKAPFAKIPGQFTPATPARGQDVDQEGLGPPQPTTATGTAGDSDPTGLRLDDDLDHHTYYNGALRWNPIASGTADAASRVR